MTNRNRHRNQNLSPASQGALTLATLAFCALMVPVTRVYFDVVIHKHPVSPGSLVDLLLPEHIRDDPAWLIVAMLLAAAICLIPAAIYIGFDNKRMREKITSMASVEHGVFSTEGSITAPDFLILSPSILKEHEFSGIYILHNEPKNKSYVGQSARVLERAKKHLTGHGNGDVYADLKNGDSFTIKTIPLIDSGYQSLDDLERDAIEAFDAYTKGYNKTRGNNG